MEFDRYFVVLLKTGPNHDPISEEDAQALQAAHLNHIRDMAEQGKLAIAGPFNNAPEELRGMFILTVETLEEAQAITDSDPAVKAGRLTVIIAPWMVEKGALVTNVDTYQ